MTILLGYEEALFPNIFLGDCIYVLFKPKAIITLTGWLQPFSIKSPISFHLSVTLKYQAVMHTELTVLKVW